MKSIIRFWKGILPICAMLMLIFDSKTGLTGAVEGINLCIRAVIPSLFPFIVLSGYLTGNIGSIKSALLTRIGSLLKIPSGMETLFITGMIGGYPVGAQVIAQAHNAGMLDREQARRMMGFCNNAGPAFLFGMLAPFFSGLPILWLLWFIHILSAMIVGFLLPEEGIQNPRAEAIQKEMTFPVAVTRAVRIIGLICGWVILFRIIYGFLNKWLFRFFPVEIRVLLCGILELTNGCVSLADISQEHIRFVLAVVFLNFGGVCVGMQTSSVIGALGSGFYFPGKLLQAGIGLLLSGLALPCLYPGYSLPYLIPFALLWTLALMISLYFPKITVAFSGFSVYNKKNMTK